MRGIPVKRGVSMQITLLVLVIFALVLLITAASLLGQTSRQAEEANPIQIEFPFDKVITGFSRDANAAGASDSYQWQLSEFSGVMETAALRQTGVATTVFDTQGNGLMDTSAVAWHHGGDSGMDAYKYRLIDFLGNRDSGAYTDPQELGTGQRSSGGFTAIDAAAVDTTNNAVIDTVFFGYTVNTSASGTDIKYVLKALDIESLELKEITRPDGSSAEEIVIEDIHDTPKKGHDITLQAFQAESNGQGPNTLFVAYSAIEQAGEDYQYRYKHRIYSFTDDNKREIDSITGPDILAQSGGEDTTSPDRNNIAIGAAIDSTYIDTTFGTGRKDGNRDAVFIAYLHEPCDSCGGLSLQNDETIYRYDIYSAETRSFERNDTLLKRLESHPLWERQPALAVSPFRAEQREQVDAVFTVFTDQHFSGPLQTRNTFYTYGGFDPSKQDAPERFERASPDCDPVATDGDREGGAELSAALLPSAQGPPQDRVLFFYSCRDDFEESLWQYRFNVFNPALSEAIEKDEKWYWFDSVASSAVVPDNYREVEHNLLLQNGPALSSSYTGDLLRPHQTCGAAGGSCTDTCPAERTIGDMASCPASQPTCCQPVPVCQGEDNRATDNSILLTVDSGSDGTDDRVLLDVEHRHTEDSRDTYRLYTDNADYDDRADNGGEDIYSTDADARSVDLAAMHEDDLRLRIEDNTWGHTDDWDVQSWSVFYRVFHDNNPQCLSTESESVGDEACTTESNPYVLDFDDFPGEDEYASLAVQHRTGDEESGDDFARTDAAVELCRENTETPSETHCVQLDRDRDQDDYNDRQTGRVDNYRWDADTGGDISYHLRDDGSEELKDGDKFFLRTTGTDAWKFDNWALYARVSVFSEQTTLNDAGDDNHPHHTAWRTMRLPEDRYCNDAGCCQVEDVSCESQDGTCRPTAPCNPGEEPLGSENWDYCEEEDGGPDDYVCCASTS